VVPLTARSSGTPIYLDTSYSPAERAADLVGQMTLSEKASQAISNMAPAISRLGLVSLRAGEARGRHTISLRAHFPDGELGATASAYNEPRVIPLDMLQFAAASVDRKSGPPPNAG